MAELVELIVDKYDGSLKAEHGTGINMAPYVEREWGEKATELMWRVKKLADPDGVLSPGVVLNRDPGAHLRNLKTTPPIEESATTCVECGFCEPVCPSRNLTTTPRQRIVLRREMARQPAGSPVRGRCWRSSSTRRSRPAPPTAPASSPARSGSTPASWSRNCASARHTERAEKAALATARRWRAVEGASRAGLRVRRAAGAPDQARPRRCPAPAPAKLPGDARTQGAAAVYVPSCTNRIFAGSPVEALVEVSARAGLPVWIPEDVAGSCCGLPWSSKGFGDAHRHKANEMVERLWGWSGEGALPIVIDAASCTHAHRRTRRRRAQRGERRAPRASSRSSTRSPGRTTACCPGSRSPRRSARPPSTRPARPATWASPTACEALAAALADDVYVAPVRDLLRLRRRPRHLPPRADRGRHRPPGRRARRPPLRRPPLQQPHLRDRPRARHRRALRVGRDPAGAADAGIRPES